MINYAKLRISVVRVSQMCDDDNDDDDQLLMYFYFYIFADDRSVECKSREELDCQASLAKGLTTGHRLKLELE